MSLPSCKLHRNGSNCRQWLVRGCPLAQLHAQLPSKHSALLCVWHIQKLAPMYPHFRTLVRSSFPPFQFLPHFKLFLPLIFPPWRERKMAHLLIPSRNRSKDVTQLIASVPGAAPAAWCSRNARRPASACICLVCSSLLITFVCPSCDSFSAAPMISFSAAGDLKTTLICRLRKQKLWLTHGFFTTSTSLMDLTKHIFPAVSDSTYPRNFSAQELPHPQMQQRCMK